MIAMDRPIIALFVFLPFLCFKVALSATFSLRNNCPYPVWPGVLSGAGSPLLDIGVGLSTSESFIFDVPYKWSGRIWGRTGCYYDSGRFTCATGDCSSGQISCGGAGGRPPTSLAEFTMNGANGMDFYDTSLVDGFNLPIAIIPDNGGCTATVCAANINAQCPPELQLNGPDGAVVGCKSACLAYNTDEYCCRGAYASPDKCMPTSYSQMFKAACPQSYSYAFDDGTSTFTCTGANYAITFCP